MAIKDTAIRQALLRVLTVALASGAFAADAGAFTVNDASGNAVPRFDLEEQSRQFRKPDLNLSESDKKGVSTPYGNLQFGVQQRGGSSFGNSLFGAPMGSGISDANREHYQRMFTPENVQGRRD